MFIGHYAPALVAAAHPKAPRLGILFVAAQLVDIAFFTFVLAGVEKMRVVPGITQTNGMDLYYMPFTHSLLGSAVWALGFGIVVFMMTRSRIAGALSGAVVLSHWLLDLLVHRPDLTLAGSAPMFGFGLWNQPLVEMPLELGITGMALGIYYSKTRASTTAGDWPVWILAGVMLAVQLFNWLSTQPDSYDASMPITALVAYVIFALLAHWTGKSRRFKLVGEV